MRSESREYVDQYWANFFGIEQSRIWNDVTVLPHAMLDDYEGFYVTWRATGVHISTPTSCAREVAESLNTQGIVDLQTESFWQAFALAQGLRLIGPSTHLYLDIDPGPVDGVVPVDDSELGPLRALVSEEDWSEAGFDDGPAHTFGCYDEGVLVAASNLNKFAGHPRDIGVLVAPAARGRGLAAGVARHAASYAIREHDLARWGARQTNVASLRTAERLGFEPWCAQLAVR